MKKIKLVSIFVAIIIGSSVLVSCNKEEIQNIELKNKSEFSDIKVKNLNETLVFSTLEDYGKAIEILSSHTDSEFELFEKGIQFKSLRSQLSIQERKKINMTDDLLACLLNPNGMIQIENKLYEINLIDETVNEYNPQSFSTSQKASALIKSYSTNENVFDTSEGATSKVASACPNEVKKEKDIKVGGNKTVSLKVNYLRAGIYFSLHSQIKKDHFQGPLTLSMYRPAGSSYTQNKRNAKKMGIQAHSASGNEREYSDRPYNGIIGLKQHRLSVNFSCIDANVNSTVINETLTIDCN